MNCHPVIQTHELSKHYFLGKTCIPVLKGIDLVVEGGDYCAIMGHSGAGKSTLLNILGCLDSPTSGTYRLGATDVASLTEPDRAHIRSRDIGFVFQNFNLLPKLDIASNVELPLIYANLSARERKRRVEQVLVRFGLWERRLHKPNEISGGQKQRTAIARAIVKKPTLILADEPTGNLDSKTAGEILTVFDELVGEGNTVVVITHEHDVAARAHRTVKLVDGRIAA